VFSGGSPSRDRTAGTQADCQVPMTITRPFIRHFVKWQVRSNNTYSVGFTALYASTFDSTDLPGEEVNDVPAPVLHSLPFAQLHHS
jgi:hypothetical protein